jgi:predicted enzyme related to lactoylglutathione lyase
MTTPFLGLRTTIYKVDDLQKAKAWYAKVFEVEPYFDEPFYVGFNIAGYELGLMPEEKPTTPKTANVESYWGVEDIDAVFQKLMSHGATEHQAPMDVGSNVKVATVKDPWENIIGIIFNPHFKLN